MVKVYGYSDDNLVIEGASSPYDELSCYESVAKIWFSDGTIIKCGYGKAGQGIWWIDVVQEGTAEYKLTTCNDENAEIYSDVFEIDAEYVKHCFDDENDDIANLRKLFLDLKEKYPVQYITLVYEEVF